MRSVLGRAAVVAAGLLALTGNTARAAVVVDVPFPFMVEGQQFPAGEYRLQRDQMNSSVVLIRGEKGNTAARFVLTTPAAGHDPMGNMPALTFDRHENGYQLSGIWESENQGSEVSGPR
jgi:hypothetical protein